MVGHRPQLRERRVGGEVVLVVFERRRDALAAPLQCCREGLLGRQLAQLGAEPHLREPLLLRLEEDVADALEGGGGGLELIAVLFPHRLQCNEPLLQQNEIALDGVQDGLHAVRLRSIAQEDLEPTKDEIERLSIEGLPVQPLRLPDRLAKLEAQPETERDANYAERSAAQAVRIGGACRHLAYSEKASELIEAIGDAQERTEIASRQRIFRAAREVMLVDRVGD